MFYEYVSRRIDYRELGMKSQIESFFHETTYTITHVVWDPDAETCAIIDPALDFDAKSGRTGTAAADGVISFVRAKGLQTAWILETHVHADHLTAAPYLKAALGGQVGIGNRISDVQQTFKGVFNAESGFRTDGSQFDHLFSDGETFPIGGLEARVMHTPGHTPACITYVIGDAAFVGDTLFMPDYGTARCDFPGGDAATLYASVRRILELPPETRLFMCHDYKAPGRDEYAWETTVAAQRAENLHVHDGVDEAAYVKMRTERDAKLDMPALLLPSIQVNMRAGELPPPEDNGVSYLKLPLNAL
jgi:glyoxylase-like metal-dependent hydrolase (beta-lactamase superfamily II)